MAPVISAVGHAQLTAQGKRLVAASMFAKDKAFLSAAILLRQKGGYEFVVLHLLCQGIEVTLKGFLLFVDYDKYKPKLRRFGHKLLSVSVEAVKAAGLLPLKKDVRIKQSVLSAFTPLWFWLRYSRQSEHHSEQSCSSPYGRSATSCRTKGLICMTQPQPSNLALHFGRWTLRDKAAQHRLALR